MPLNHIMRAAQAPQINLPNATVIPLSSANNTTSDGQMQVKYVNLDCRVTGYPTPWIEWFRNGKLLRNKPLQQQQNNHNKLSSGNKVPIKYQIKNNKWRKRHNVRLSRLEIELQSGRNETGIYECRAMNVASREPVVGTYTLLMQSNQIALIPLQTLASQTNEADSMMQPSIHDNEQLNDQQNNKQRSPDSTPTTLIDMQTNTTTLISSDKVNPATGTTLVAPNIGLTAKTSTSIISTTTTTTSTSTTTATTTPAPISQANNNVASIHVPSLINISPMRIIPVNSGSVSSTQQPTILGPQTSTHIPIPTSQPSSPLTPMVTTTTTPAAPATTTSSSSATTTTITTHLPSGSSQATSNNGVVDQPCPAKARESFCLNGGTCKLIGHIEELVCR